MDATADGKDEEKVTAEVTRDPTYFFEDSFVVLKVENTLFRIQLSILLRHSGLFRDLYCDESLPPTFTEANPFVVNNITVQELRHFLRITLPFETEDLKRLWTMDNKKGFASVSRDEWISVLKVSTLWRCSSLRELAISKISWFGNGNLTQQIALGRKCCVSSWVEAGYKGIVENGEISDEQMEEIGLLESFKLLRISRKYQTLNPSATDNEIKETFQEELQSISTAEKEFLNPSDQNPGVESRRPTTSQSRTGIQPSDEWEISSGGQLRKGSMEPSDEREVSNGSQLQKGSMQPSDEWEVSSWSQLRRDLFQPSDEWEVASGSQLRRGRGRGRGRVSIRPR